jgi:O-succinylbenzoate synthase
MPLFSPVGTIRNNSFGSGLCSAIASLTDPLSHVSHSSGFVKSTGIALAWTGGLHHSIPLSEEPMLAGLAFAFTGP